MNIEFLSTVAVIAPDPPASRKLYVDALGLPLESRSSGLTALTRGYRSPAPAPPRTPTTPALGIDRRPTTITRQPRTIPAS
jgi:catechol 2,3-dioxygenase-like lactoylglutathione lyase family enzyme